MVRFKELSPEVRRQQVELVRATLSETLSLEQAREWLARCESKVLWWGREIGRLERARSVCGVSRSVDVAMVRAHARLVDVRRSLAFYQGRLAEMERALAFQRSLGRR